MTNRERHARRQDNAKTLGRTKIVRWQRWRGMGSQARGQPGWLATPEGVTGTERSLLHGPHGERGAAVTLECGLLSCRLGQNRSLLFYAPALQPLETSSSIPPPIVTDCAKCDRTRVFATLFVLTRSCSPASHEHRDANPLA